VLSEPPAQIGCPHGFRTHGGDPDRATGLRADTTPVTACSASASGATTRMLPTTSCDRGGHDRAPPARLVPTARLDEPPGPDLVSNGRFPVAAGSCDVRSRYDPARRCSESAENLDPNWTPSRILHPPNRDANSVFPATSLIGETGFEPATARPPAGCATRLRHSPWSGDDNRPAAIRRAARHGLLRRWLRSGCGLLCAKRATGIEPALKAWKAFVQPQHFARKTANATARSRPAGVVERRC
jgi:hypothetical protein